MEDTGRNTLKRNSWNFSASKNFKGKLKAEIFKARIKKKVCMICADLFFVPSYFINFQNTELKLFHIKLIKLSCSRSINLLSQKIFNCIEDEVGKLCLTTFFFFQMKRVTLVTRSPIVLPHLRCSQKKK